TMTWVPSEYCARILPPSPIPTWSKFAAGNPFCARAEEAEGCENWVIRGTWPLKMSHVMLMSAAPSFSPVAVSTGGADDGVGLVSTPEELKVRVPVTGVPGAFKSALGKLRE